MNCDMYCAPYGGIFNKDDMSCDWSGPTGDLERCPEDWRHQRDYSNGEQGEPECDIRCLSTGGYYEMVEYEWGEYEECRWSNIHSTELFEENM